MTARGWAALAAVLYLAGVLTLFGYRSIRHRRATGDIGFRGFSNPDPLVRISGALFAAAIVIGFTAPALTALGAMPTVTVAGDATALALPGLSVVLVALAITWSAQTAMGPSWRIGVDEGEVTALVTDGIFERVRNPIFTAMIIAQAGSVLMAPSPLSLLGPPMLILACELQVRFVEEPHLRNLHGDTYDAYTARAGRFLPGVGLDRSVSDAAEAAAPQKPR